MKYRIPLFLIISSILITTLTFCSKRRYIDFVDPFIGTDGIVHTFPGATTPFGMIQLSPDSDTKGWNWCSGYHSSDSSIKGFSHNHLSGTGWADLGDILVTATTGAIQLHAGSKENPDEGYRSRISHDPANEKAKAGYYMVNLLDYGVKAELTASKRVGYHLYTFPKTDSGNIIIDPTNKIFGKVIESKVSIINNFLVIGYAKSKGWGGHRTVHFAASFSQPFTEHVIDTGKLEKIGLAFKNPKQILVKVALSHVTMNGALINLKTDDDKKFFQVRHEAENMWEAELSKFKFDGVSNDQMKILYTGLYHAMIQPNLNQDINGDYFAQGQTINATGYINYSTFSFWDTFRAVHPLLTITNHEITADIVNTLSSRYFNDYEEGEMLKKLPQFENNCEPFNPEKEGLIGHLPLWELLGYDNACMIGYPAVAVMSDAIMKDIKGINYEAAYAAMRDAAFYDNKSSSDGPSGIPEYIKLGYVPAGFHASVSKTMEYSYYDWCIARVAEKLGKKEDAAIFYKRSENYKNHWREDKKLMWPKDSLGNWIEDMSLTSWESLKPHYISGNVWAYSYFYPHATEEMIKIVGGKENFAMNMDETLSTELKMEGEQHVDISGFVGQYGHGDEPGHQFLYLYNPAGATWKITDRVRQISKMFYNSTRNAMPNNDDCGQMSAWYIFSSMGFYPICPGDNKYYIGSPMINGVTIETASGKKFTMKAEGLSEKNIYVESATINGKPITNGYITHKQIMEGGKLVFKMSDTPNKQLFNE